MRALRAAFRFSSARAYGRLAVPRHRALSTRAHAATDADAGTTTEGVAVKQPLTVLRLPRLPIAQQLVIEEALLRADNRNWCVLNQPRRTHALPLGFLPTPTEADARTSERAVVLGLSGDAHALLHVDRARADAVPLIRRFSGGGTVYVDHNTKFITLIVNQSALPHVQCFPKPVMHWTARLYAQALGNRYVDTTTAPGAPPVRVADDEFALWENDYCIGTRKFGGNAQCFTRQRWLHHTSFLWDYSMPLIQRYLTMPSRRPAYRADRSHSDFLVRLQTHPFFRAAYSAAPATSSDVSSARAHATAVARDFAAAADANAAASAGAGTGAGAGDDDAVDRYLNAAVSDSGYNERFEDALVQALRRWFDVRDPTSAGAVIASGAADWHAVEAARAEWVAHHSAGPMAAEHLQLTRVVTYEELDAIARTKAQAAAAAAAAGAAS